jgi:hypothetical protein
MVTRDDAYTTLPPRSERSIAGLFGDLARESTRLLRQEIALAKSEMLAKLAQIGMGAGELVAGGLILYAGFLVLLAAAVLGLSGGAHCRCRRPDRRSRDRLEGPARHEGGEAGARAHAAHAA